MDNLILNQSFKLKFYFVLVWDLGKLRGYCLPHVGYSAFAVLFESKE